MFVGIDLGGINIAIGLVDESYRIITKGSVPTGREREFSDIMADAAELTNKLLEKANASAGDIRAIGLGGPGVPDVDKKEIVHSSNFPKIHHSSVLNELEKYFPGIPVYVENDANAAAYGEAIAGAARGVQNAVVVTLGTGVGGGVIIDGKIYAGFNHAGSELGHMVLDINGPACNCGRRGCFEVYASATALIQQTMKAAREHPESLIHQLIEGDMAKINGKTAFDAAKQGDATGRMVVEQFTQYLGIGLVNVVNIFQPEMIVLGGGICKEGDYLLNPLKAYLKKYTYTGEVPQTKLKTAVLGNDAGIIGAAMLWKLQEK